jgi:hydrogenase nickel incorporation protein HypA/HybF
VHELSYCEAVLEAVERRARGRRVARVGVRIGAAHRVVEDAFQQSFTMAAAGGPAADATTDVVVIPVRGHCMDCRCDFAAADPAPACPECGSLDVVAQGGDEVILEWLEYTGDATSGSPPETGAPDVADERVPPHTHSQATTHGKEG